MLFKYVNIHNIINYVHWGLIKSNNRTSLRQTTNCIQVDLSTWRLITTNPLLRMKLMMKVIFPERRRDSDYQKTLYLMLKLLQLTRTIKRRIARFPESNMRKADLLYAFNNSVEHHCSQIPLFSVSPIAYFLLIISETVFADI